ncbi:hypothetical protein OEM_20230 [Mycobacterium intracellulare subsp. yongonense 05-1390]|uniref:hypothetical protein n=1 Tax=Mycobacterium TaxID=1763 RepID=UPI00025D5758|nr:MULTISPECIES: hypothetical protein [Mycobacterium]AFJ35073.1 hypothetical protein W7S_10510 [Mycobacterium sp. MOTT36Y]AGP63558.1 hypothetical protein OEM_20230 [Mycobacterium intracellulare subsp. yongonense 05-1390]ELR84816.1 hypothetical protein W7U_06280 [Mycobacterium sp. H4Y]PBA55297.1 hypothetical protein CKJ57_11600 [Mycobacterium intracellulare subsp. chimaera]
MTTDHSKEGRPRNGTTFSDTDSPSVTQQHDSTPNDKWRDDWYRRCIRASVDEQYYHLMPLGVRLQANVIRARFEGGDAA